MKILISNGQSVVSKTVTPKTTYTDLEKMIVSQDGFDLGSFVITSQGEELAQGTLADNQVSNGDVLNLALVVDGGKKKKKKKKNFKNPKKNKHIHVNTKLKILTYYNINADNTVSRTKMVSPYAPPGRVTYMARHKDRQYCGRAQVALMIEDDQ